METPKTAEVVRRTPAPAHIRGWRHREKLSKDLNVLGDERLLALSGVPEKFEATYVDSRLDHVRLVASGFNKEHSSQVIEMSIMPWERDVLIEELQHHQNLYPHGQDLGQSPIWRLDTLMHQIYERLQLKPAPKDAKDLAARLGGMKTAWKIVTGSDWSDVHWNANGAPIQGTQSKLIPRPGIFDRVDSEDASDN